MEKKQGKGTFVSKPKFTKDIKKLQSFTEMCEHMGMKSGGRMLENKLIVADEKTRNLLGLEKGSQVVYISRVRYADNEPVAIENNYFPLKYAFLLGETFDSNSLFEFMKDKAGVMVAVSEKWIELCKATTREAELLQLCLLYTSTSPEEWVMAHVSIQATSTVRLRAFWISKNR